MKFPVIIKQSPLILIRRIIEVELFIGVILFFISLVGNYEELYRSSPIGDIFRYDLFLILGVSIIQLLVTFLVFLAWNREEYRLRETEIVRRTGMFFAREHSVLLKNISSVEYGRNALELMLGYGTITLTTENGNKDLYIRSVETPEIYANLIKDAVDAVLDRKKISPQKLSILDLILEGEHSRLEFKQTLRYDLKKKDVNKILEKAVMKTVAAFLNSNGGTLLIGITDSGGIYGLEDDYHTLVRKDRDGFENHFSQIMKVMIGAEFRQHVTLLFEKIEDKDVCLVEVEKSNRPAYLKANGEEEFFIRTGNSTSPLKISEVNTYIDSHWEK
jgi:uncharacterized membrane protein YdbT with pleckstrin-like domain